MDYLQAIDVSRWQGVIDWPSVPSNIPIAIIKVSGGDAGLYFDSQATNNYNGATAAGKAVGLYHFAGGGDPVAEAEFFVKGCSPLAENDVYALDWEIQHADPVGWCLAFVNRVHELTGAWPLIYMNGSTLNAYDWSPVRANCGTWVAWYGRDPEATLPVSGVYVMHQYSSSGSVPGIAGAVDMDAVFMNVETFKKYGYHQTNVPTPPPAPTPEPAPQPPAPDPVPAPDPPQPDPEPQPTPEPDPTPQPEPEPTPPEPSPTPQAPATTLAGIIAAVVAALGLVIAGLIHWWHSL